MLADTLAAVGEKLERPADPASRSRPPTGRSSPTARTSTCTPTPTPSPPRSRGWPGPPRPTACAATSPTWPSCTGCSCARSSTATSTRRWTCSAPSCVALARRGGFGRLSRHVERALRRRPAAPAVQLPGALRRRLPVPGDRRLRRHRPARHRRRRLAPGGRHRRRAPGAGRRRRRRRRGVPLRRRRSPRWRCGRPGRPPSGWPTASGCPRTPSSSPTDAPLALVPGLRAPRRPVYSPSLRGPAPRRPRRAARPGAPHDQLRRRLGAGVRRADPRRRGR